MHLDHLPGTFFGPSNLVELLRHRAHCQPQDTAFTYLVDGEHEEIHLTYRELDRQARAIGAWLESQDLAGERALLLYPAGLEFIAAFFGCMYGGVIAVPVYLLLATAQFAVRSIPYVVAFVDGVAQRMPDDWLDAFSAAGTPDQVAGAIQRLIDAGADSIVFQPLNGDPDCLDEYIHDLMPQLKSTLAAATN